jgi:hypothetical protein
MFFKSFSVVNNLIVLAVVLLHLTLSSHGQDLDQLDELYDYLLAAGNEARVGFLTPSNYASVRRKLPANTKPVYIDDKDNLAQMVINGSLIAGLTSGLPEKVYHDRLHIFSSTIVTMHSMLMSPDQSSDNPHGAPFEKSTYDLSMALNAAISRVQLKGIDQEIAMKNAPKEIVSAHTCKEDDQSQFQIPNRSEAKGVLREILDKKVIKVLGNGPYNWGDNDGNYLVDPPVGFYPDLLEAIIEEFRNLSGSDKEPYGDIRFERMNTVESPFPWYRLFDGTVHITEPYFILDAPYGGSGKSCQSDQDCFGANLPPANKERCNVRWCSHPNRPRYIMFRSSCSVLGTDSKFFTKRNRTAETSSSSTTMTHSSTRSSGISEKNHDSHVGLTIAIVLLAVAVFGLLGAMGFIIFKEKRGKPVFIRFQ